MADEKKPTKNLWGELPTAEAFKTPKVVLQEQADILYESTGGRLQGRIDTNTMAKNIVHEFFVVAPFVNHYSVNILDVYHDALAYPVKVKNNMTTVRGLIDLASSEYTCNNVEELEKTLADVLQSKAVRNVIMSLLAQSQ